MSFFGWFFENFDFLGGAMLVEVLEVSNQKLLAHEIATPPTHKTPRYTFSKVSVLDIPVKYPVISGCVSILGPLKGHDELPVPSSRPRIQAL